MQVDASLQSQNNCTWTCDGWPNGFASRLTSSRKSQKVVNSTCIQLTCDQLVLNCVGWPNGKKNLSTNLSLTRVNSSHHKWVAKQNTARMLHWFTSLFGQGFKTSQAGLGLGWLGNFRTEPLWPCSCFSPLLWFKSFLFPKLCHSDKSTLVPLLYGHIYKHPQTNLSSIQTQMLISWQ